MVVLNILETWISLEKYYVLENNIHDVAWFCVILVSGLAFRKFLSRNLSRFFYLFLKSSAGDVKVQDFVDLFQKPLEWFLLMLVILLSCSFLHYPVSWHLDNGDQLGLKMFINRGYGTLFMASLAWTTFRMVDFFALVLRSKASNQGKSELQIIYFVRELVKVSLVVFYFFATLAVVFDLNVGATITGLGIGGLAFALAGKETLENLLASVTIFLDKPFVAGDWIKTGEVEGTIEKVGFRSTRIRTLNKSLITLPNKILVDQALENLTYRTQWRARFKLGLSYDTPADAVKSCVRDLKELLLSESLIDPSYIVVLEELGITSLEVLVVFLVNVSTASEFLAVREQINFGIIQILKKNGVLLAYPTTRVLYSESAV